MNTPQQIIAQLIHVPLITENEQQIRELLHGLGKFGFIELSLHAGNSILRARPLQANQSIGTVADLSFKPQQYNTTYQRASTPGQTMFYGCLLQPEFQPEGFRSMARAAGMLESIPAIRNKATKGIWKIGFGNWEITHDLRLAALCYKEDLAIKNPQTARLYDAFHNQLKNYPEMEQDSRIVTDYLAYQFGKDVPPGDHEQYIISAVFSEICHQKQFDGIIFPSVRTNGQGINLAIHPDVVDQHMKLCSAGICSIYKNADHTIVLNDSIATLAEGDSTFTLQPVGDPQELANEIQRVKTQLKL